MTEQADLSKAMTELTARARQRAAQCRALEKEIKDRWRQWVSVVGLNEAKRMFTEQTGLQFAGRPERRDVLDDLIDQGIEYVMSLGVKKINQKRFAQMLQNSIKKQPLTDHVLVADDGDWDYEEVVAFRYDKDTVVRVDVEGTVRTRETDDALRKRISAAIKRYKEAHSS